METKTVLVVAPNPKMHEAAGPLAAYVGIETTTCKRVADAVELLVKRVRIDLIAAEAFMDAGRDDDVFTLIKAVRALPREFQRPIWVFAAEPGPMGTQLAQHTGEAVRRLGADRFFIARFEDIPRLVAEIQAALDQSTAIQISPGTGGSAS